MEEEVQAGWDVVGGENDIPGAINCPRCGEMLIPSLGYRTLSTSSIIAMAAAAASEESSSPSKKEGKNDDDFASLPPQIRPTIDDVAQARYVAYMSPATLRLSLERHIEEQGEEILERERLRELDPEVYYNLWWYSARFSLPLPLPIYGEDTSHYCAMVAWDYQVAFRGCVSAAKVMTALFDEGGNLRMKDDDDDNPLDAYGDFPLLARFNLQGYYSTVWDHPDLSKILVTLVEACDKRDFGRVMETLMQVNNQERRRQSQELLEGYRTALYLAKYQCTSAFHAFFPATLKPCKGYHFWCPITTLPIFDRLLREAIARQKAKSAGYTPFWDVSDVALGFRSVFGHLM